MQVHFYDHSIVEGLSFLIHIYIISYSQATNVVGLYTISVSDVFLCDNTAPEGGYIRDGESPDKVSDYQRKITYCRTHNVRVCLYIANIAFGSASLYIKTLHYFICTFFMLAAATVANIKICYDAKTRHFPIFGTHIICVFHSISFF